MSDDSHDGHTIDLGPPSTIGGHTSAGLLEALTELGHSYGPLGVALAAAELTDASVVAETLRPEAASLPTERWLAVAGPGDYIRLLPTPGAIGPDVFVKLASVRPRSRRRLVNPTPNRDEKSPQ